MNIALVGNQNSGKSTLFNKLTGMNQKIGNWPGVTIEKKEGIIKNSSHQLIDLPGLYSLNSFSMEEKISEQYLLNNKIDLIINVVDATSIERSLYLTTQLLELNKRVIVVLNMIDLASKKGLCFNIKEMEKNLGCSVLEISASEGKGIDKLLLEIEQEKKIESLNIYPFKIESLLRRITSKKERFLQIRELETNQEYLQYKEEIESYYNKEFIQVIAEKRYEYIEKLKEKCLIKKTNKNDFTFYLDKIFLNKYLAIPLFVLIFFLVYFISLNLMDTFTSKLITKPLNFLIDKSKMGRFPIISSLLKDGILTGVGTVLGFLPKLIVLYFFLILLEASGYMARISFILDCLFKRLGLSGKSLIPFIVGSGCSVPGIMSARIIEKESERDKTIMLTPFIPCGAKLPIISFFATNFFPKNAALISLSFYLLMILVLILTALILKKIERNKETSYYISELPNYKLPKLDYLIKEVSLKVFSFLKRAGTIILVSSVFIWFLMSFSWNLKYVTTIEESILSSIGKAFSWILFPVIGKLNWQATVATIEGLFAKEQVISSLAILGKQQPINFSPLSAYSFVAFNLLTIPCISSVSCLKKELTKKEFRKAITIELITSFGVASSIFWLGKLLINI